MDLAVWLGGLKLSDTNNGKVSRYGVAETKCRGILDDTLWQP